MPHLGDEGLFARIDLERSWRDSVQGNTFRAEPAAFRHPFGVTPADAEWPVISYAGNERVMRPAAAGRLGYRYEDLTDGSSNTILLGEIAVGCPAWGRPGNVRDPAEGVRSPYAFLSPWTASGRREFTIFGMCDGSVRLVNADVDRDVMRALATPDGGENDARGF